MARIITKELAQRIAKKLDAQIVSSGKAHDIAYVYHEGQLIAQFGIRHGSKKDLGHDHVPRDLHIGPSQAKRLGQCPLSRDGFIQLLRERGLIQQPEQDTGTVPEGIT
jgi:hypothetical protein